MLFRGTRKRSAALGSAAFVAGATLSVFGIAPTAQANAQNVPYTCAVSVTYLDVGGLPISENDEADMSLNIAGGVSGLVEVGDAVTLTGFQTLGNVSGNITSSPGYQLATSITGHYDAFPVVAELGGKQQTVAPGIDISQTTPSDTGFTVQSPQAPMDVTGFTADQPGTMTFAPGATVTGSFSVDMPTGTQQWPFTCHTGDTSQIASVQVKAKPAPPTSPPPSHGSPPPSHGSQPPSHGSQSGQQDLSQPAGLSNGSPSADPSSSGNSTTTPTGSVSNTRSTAQPQLANSGFPQALELTVGGGLLVLVGAGLMFAARRRGVTDLDT